MAAALVAAVQAQTEEPTEAPASDGKPRIRSSGASLEFWVHQGSEQI